MLWYKSFLETRSRFLIGLVVLLMSVSGTIYAYPRVQRLLPMVQSAAAFSPAPVITTARANGGLIAERLKEIADLSSTYRGYIWAQALRQNVTQMLSLFAVLLGAGGLLSSGSRGTLFTLSLPVSRQRLLGVRTAVGLIELAALAFVPLLLFPAMSPAVGQHYGIGDTLIHGVCFFVAGAVLFSAAALVSTVFHDQWRPILIVCAFAVALGIAEPFFGDYSRYSLFGIMDGEIYFRGGRVPWVELLATAAVSAALLFAASRNLARQDF
jgi:ABC-type transport system involved in multi-copper enzyme maturation permease subunit